MDLCTVVFRDEIPTLKLQAQSVALYCQDIGIRSIYVVVNDDDEYAAYIDSAWWGPLSHLVRIITRSTYSSTWVENGWVSQQVLKLITAAVSNNSWCMILDAKSFFVKKIDLMEIMPAGKPLVGELDVYPVFERSRQIAEDLFQIKLDKQLGPGGVPFILHTSSVRSMIAEAETRTGQNFVEWFQAQGMLTEFILYSAYLQYRYQGFGHLYGREFKLINVNVCHSEAGMFDQKFQQMLDQNSLSVSVHRNAWTQLSVEQQQRYQKFLNDRGIQ